MKEIILKDDKNTIPFSEVNENSPIFAKKNGILQGMVVKEENRGWIVRIGGGAGMTGHYNTLIECLNSCVQYGYTFHTK